MRQHRTQIKQNQVYRQNLGKRAFFSEKERFARALESQQLPPIDAQRPVRFGSQLEMHD
jgi:hypothetical protein